MARVAPLKTALPSRSKCATHDIRGCGTTMNRVDIAVATWCVGMIANRDDLKAMSEAGRALDAAEATLTSQERREYLARVDEIMRRADDEEKTRD